MWRVAVCHVFSTAAGKNKERSDKNISPEWRSGQRPGSIGRRGLSRAHGGNDANGGGQ